MSTVPSIKTASKAVKEYIKTQKKERGFRKGDIVHLSDDIYLVVTGIGVCDTISLCDIDANSLEKPYYVWERDVILSCMESHYKLEDIMIEGKQV